MSKFDVSSVSVNGYMWIFKLVILLTSNSSKLIVILLSLGKSYTVTIVWEFTSADSALVVLDEWPSQRWSFEQVWLYTVFASELLQTPRRNQTASDALILLLGLYSFSYINSGFELVLQTFWLLFWDITNNPFLRSAVAFKYYCCIFLFSFFFLYLFLPQPLQFHDQHGLHS